MASTDTNDTGVLNRIMGGLVAIIIVFGLLWLASWLAVNTIGIWLSLVS